ncbi:MULTISPECIES: SRPBCC domain-containing protein [unclassified Kitasatospora]|uniref:SRPBCC family protein n=1 Tax=unclassified Kitasatospora TaxID=2633591 RepID=UPI00343B955B
MTENLGELTITRELPATPDAVFRAYVEPEQFVRFWGPVGTHVELDTVTIEPRVGGRYDSTMTIDATGDAYPMCAKITEIRPGELIALVEESVGLRSTMTFKDLGDGRTEVVLHQTEVPAMYCGPEARAGLNSSFDRLVEHLAAQR